MKPSCHQDGEGQLWKSHLWEALSVVSVGSGARFPPPGMWGSKERRGRRESRQAGHSSLFKNTPQKWPWTSLDLTIIKFPSLSNRMCWAFELQSKHRVYPGCIWNPQWLQGLALEWKLTWLKGRSDFQTVFHNKLGAPVSWTTQSSFSPSTFSSLSLYVWIAQNNGLHCDIVTSWHNILPIFSCHPSVYLK